MTKIINARILASLAMLLFVGTVVASSTGAFFSDTETSTGNTFTAGSLDLKVDSEAHYNGSTCLPDLTTTGNSEDYTWQGGTIWPVGQPCDGTWSETDLGVTHQFFQIVDAKPGDKGEDTISLHVYDNDAWGRFVISNVQDDDNTCTEPESDGNVNDPECNAASQTDLNNGLGELAESINFFAWLDQGAVLGFQCNDAVSLPDGDACADDPTEGDNIRQDATEPIFITAGDVDEAGEIHNIWQGLAAYRLSLGTSCDAGDLDGDGHNAPGGVYGLCHGLADDGRMVGSVTYYFGLGWEIPELVGNEAQTDSLSATMAFEVEQHRNNPTPF